MHAEKNTTSIRLALIYALFGAIWIISSDRVLAVLVDPSSAAYINIQTIKGWLFVGASAALIYFILRRDMQALNARETRFLSLIEHGLDNISLLAADGTLLWENPATFRTLGYEYNAFRGRNIFELVHPEDLRWVQEQYERMLEQPRTEQRATFRVQHSNGSWRWIECIGSNLLDEPNVNGIIINYRDVTERREAEEKNNHHIVELEMLYESGLTLSQLLSQKQVGQKLIELIGQKMEWHHTVIRLYHPQNETLELLAFGQAIDEDEKPADSAVQRLSQSVSKTSEGLTGWSIQNSVIVRSGNLGSDPRYKETYSGMQSGLYVPMKSGTSTIGIISIESEKPDAFSQEDERLLITLANQAAVAIENARLYQTAQKEIDERKRIELLLADEKNQLTHRVEQRTADLSQAIQDLARALRVKDEFLASMSHELRTPLTGILGLSEALQLNVYGELNEKQQKTVKTIEESGNHLLDLINDILDLTKIESGKFDLHFAPCSITDICQASLRLITGMAQRKRQNVDFSMDPPVIIMRADGRRLKQMLTNLLSNAVKFTPEGGNIGLDIKVNDIEKNVHFTVWDRGIGIKPADLDKIFMPFIQIDSGLSREFAGTGLGLSLVQRLAGLHSGRVNVTSIPGEGSRFTIILPMS